MENNKEKRENLEENERKKAEFEKSWIGQRKKRYQNAKEKEAYLKYSQMI